MGCAEHAGPRPAGRAHVTTDSIALQRVQVGNLTTATEVQLRALFLAHGPVVSYERTIDAFTARPGAFVYIEMAHSDAAAAIKALNGHKLGTGALTVTTAKPLAGWAPESGRRPASPQPRRTVLEATPRPAATPAEPRT